MKSLGPDPHPSQYFPHPLSNQVQFIRIEPISTEIWPIKEMLKCHLWRQLLRCSTSKMVLFLKWFIFSKSNTSESGIAEPKSAAFGPNSLLTTRTSRTFDGSASNKYKYFFHICGAEREIALVNDMGVI